MGLMLPDSIPQGQRQRFESMLSSLTVMRQQEATPTEVTPTDQGETTRQEEKPRQPQVTEGEEQASTSTMISKGLLTGLSEFVFFAYLIILTGQSLVSSPLSRVMRKPTFCICENKDADQLCCNREADQRLCFRYIDSISIYFLNLKFQASSYLL